QDPATISPGNSISALVAEKAPQLQDGYSSPDDLWMLYDWRFDLLSNGAQQFLLNKYGYANSLVSGLDSDARESPRASKSVSQSASAAAAPAPGANVNVSKALFQVGRRLQSETTIVVNGS